MENKNNSELYNKYKIKKRRYFESNFPDNWENEYKLFKKFIKMPKILGKEILLNNLIKNIETLILEDNVINNSGIEIYSALSDDLNDFSLSDIKIENASFNLIENKKSDENEKDKKNDCKTNIKEKIILIIKKKDCNKERKKNSDSSSRSKDLEEGNNSNNSSVVEDEYKPSMKNEPLRNIICHHNRIAPDNLEIIDNNGRSNCLYLAISYHIYNNYNHHRNIRYLIVNKLIQKAQGMPMITINNNLGENIPIIKYANTIFKDGELSWDAEISMIPLIYDNIRAQHIN